MDKEKEKNNILEAIQKFLENPPVVIWGSGATIPYGIYYSPKFRQQN